MFEQILIALGGDQPPPGGTAAKPDRSMATSRQGEPTPETLRV
jgi:hypothetical protein